MTRSGLLEAPAARQLRRVLILADESAHWQVAGLRQLDRLLLSLDDFARTSQPHVPVRVRVFWDPKMARNKVFSAETSKLESLEIKDGAEKFLENEPPDLVLDTRLFLYRDSVPSLIATTEPSGMRLYPADWQSLLRESEEAISSSLRSADQLLWEHLASRESIPETERRFLKQNGKSQDGLASRYVNRALSRLISRWLVKTRITPSAWSVAIFSLPLCGAVAFLQGTYLGFVIGCAIFQLYSILDGCDGEIARAKFLHSEFGRRLDSLCDLIGNILLALALGIGLARHTEGQEMAAWFYLAEGLAAAILIALSEGIVFIRRSRSEEVPAVATKWNGALYQRHHEFLERSGILFLGEHFAWWLVQLTKRDMAMLAFLILALIGRPEYILHLLFLVAGVSSALAGNAFLRQPDPVLPQEAS